MKIFVTGATGFIGKNLVPVLLDHGHTIRCLTRPHSIKPEPFINRVDWFVGDILDPDSLKDACIDIDIIIHMAGAVKSNKAKTYYHVNVGGTKNLLDAMHSSAKPNTRIIFLSSQAAIGPSPDLSPLDEDYCPLPISDYGRSKLEAERLITGYKNLDYTILRPSIVYGPEDHDSLKIFTIAGFHLNPKIGFTHTTLNFIHVADLAELICLCVSNIQASYEIFHANDGNDAGYSLGHIVRLAAKLQNGWVVPIFVPKYILKIAAGINNQLSKMFGTASIFNPDKYKELTARGWVLSSQKARDRLGFHPKYNINRGFEMTIDWYRKNKWL